MSIDKYNSNQESTSIMANTVSNKVSTTNLSLSREERLAKRDLRRIKEAAKELDSLGPKSGLIVYTKRVRKQANHPNDEYANATIVYNQDVLPKGGLRKGSGHHYDREY
jgi:hypothetical protein